MGCFGPQSNQPIKHANQARFLFPPFQSKIFLHSRLRLPRDSASPPASSSSIDFSASPAKFFLFNRYRFLISRVTVVMAKKRNLAPEESSQLVEPPLKQHQSEAQQEDDQAFEQSSSSKKRNLEPEESSQLVEPPLMKQRSEALQEIVRVFGPAHPDPLLESYLARPDFKYLNYGVQRRVVDTFRKKQELEAFWKHQLEERGHNHPAFRGIGPFGRGIPTSVQKKKFEAVGGFPYTVPIRNPSSHISIATRPAITEEHGGTSGQTAYNYERFESCVAIAGADYCVIVVDFPRDHPKIFELSPKCVMAACRGFQADMEALQVLSAENLKYEGQHKKPMSCPEMDRLFCPVQLFHPIYDFILLGGLDSEGKGCLFQHFNDDAPYSSRDYGSRPSLPVSISPILNYKKPTKDVLAQLSETQALNLAKDVFASTTNTGDKLEIVVLNANGCTHYCEDLKRNNSAVRFNC